MQQLTLWKIYTPTLYILPACMNSKLTKHELKKLKVEYTVVDISASKEGLKIAKDLGIVHTPLVAVYKEGELVYSFSGYNPEELAQIALLD